MFDSGRVLRFEVPIESDADVAALEGALLAARAAELAQMRRRGDRQAFGYGSDSARETMSDEVDQAQRRWTMLDRQLAALKAVNPRG
jgi:alpha-D-ribose 1-methylphosphonate 5-triphosphate synthase subunit PhnI